MAEEKNKNGEKKEDCPLCRISEETIRRLKEKGGGQKTEEKLAKNNEK